MRVTERRWVVNASPLIFLAQIDKLSLLKELADEALVPFSVRDEVLAPKGKKPPVELPGWLSLREDLRAKKSKLIPIARPLLEELLRKGLYLSRELLEQALGEVGE